MLDANDLQLQNGKKARRASTARLDGYPPPSAAGQLLVLDGLHCR
jgi:hypothetical protein